MATHDLSDFLKQRRDRQANITAAHVLLERQQLYAIDVLLHENLLQATTEEQRFREQTGEALPPQASYALETEISMLERLTEGIAVFSQSEPTANDYTHYVHYTSAYLAHHDHLLQLEIAILNTCLVSTFYEEIDAIIRAAAAIPL